ncbi:MAG: DUF4271 domain-containing protein [Saprospiraceae bacterium]|jgi:hypothetical protein|nr:DUF4271 domain-containing protein [Saprospiraceae bacterium]MBK7372199.1 DUF4271 domain-containing protein [Saprospiraceae bacterium]MBK7435337.1 DUF4271 domain-containing protein [Saprospiraceae bacterium]MBK8282241.1 DUF4271 domain-containing protein [Saprospiraceae bacterium]MBK8510941.1 DUF4271 domain-containing protein [Saprospiraceae bacterium]
MKRNIFNNFLILLLTLTCAYKTISQNPFDIKKPGSEVPPTVVKKLNPPAVVKKADTVIRSTSNGSSILQDTTKTLITEKPQASTPASILNSTTSGSIAPTGHLNLPKSPTSGLDGGNNPFNIIPPSATNPSPTVKSNEPNVQPGVQEIKEKVVDFKEATTNNNSTISKNAWFIIYIFLFLMAAIAINFNRSYPIALIKATYNQNQLRSLFKEAFKGNHMMIFGILYFIFIINAGIFTYLSFKIFQMASLSLFMCILIVLVVYLVRHLVMLVLAQVFPLEKEAAFFSFTIGIHNLALGLALMLINICLSFVDEETGKMLIFSGLSLILVLYALRQIRGLLNNIPTILSGKFHFIIYLCTVEIAPWILLAGMILK